MPINSSQAVYMSAVAEEVTGEDRGQLLETFSRRSQQHGAGAWRIADVEPPARLRLYVATVDEQ